MLKIEGVISEFPSGLKTAEEVSAETGLISAKRLNDLAEGGFAPHFKIDGGQPMFKIAELKKWLAVNLVQKVEGKPLPETIKIGLQLNDLRKLRKLPHAFAEVTNIYDITGEYNRSGVYILCVNDEVQYIGQAVCVHNRVSSHDKCPSKHFNQVLFIPWAKDDLDRLEGALIRVLRPPLNGNIKPSGLKVAPSEPYHGSDIEVLTFIGVVKENGERSDHAYSS